MCKAPPRQPAVSGCQAAGPTNLRSQQTTKPVPMQLTKGQCVMPRALFAKQGLGGTWSAAGSEGPYRLRYYRL